MYNSKVFTQVAVKIFESGDKEHWERETQVFQESCLRHENLVKFIAADSKDTGLTLQHWIIMEYYPYCLYDYLQLEVLAPDVCLQFCFSISKGLNFLHTPIEGTRGKPAIAHMDIKSNNILIKASGACVIGDLGLGIVRRPEREFRDGMASIDEKRAETAEPAVAGQTRRKKWFPSR